MFHILVVDDDAELRRSLCAALVKNGYRATAASDGEEALHLFEKKYFDLMICDVLMPNLNGYELTSILRTDKNIIPILMITALDTFADMRRGFSAGADDYMKKPVDVNELLLRVEALLRRARLISERRIVCGGLVLDYDDLTVSGDGVDELLPQKEFYLLYKLISGAGKIFTRQQLMDEIWGMDSSTNERTVDVHVNRLRERFKDRRDFQLVTVRGIGYKAVKNKD